MTVARQTEPEDELVGRVRTWLESQGYPFEMKVAQQLRSAGARIIQSEYYQDPEQPEVSREIDLVASWSRSEERNIGRVSLAVECKLSASKPWIVFSSRRRLAGPAQVVQRAATPFGASFLNKVKEFRETQSLPLIQLPGRVGYGIREALSDKTDVAYQAIMSAAKAASALPAFPAEGAASIFIP